MPYSVVLIEDHRIVREGIKAILERGTEFRVVSEAESGVNAVQICRKFRPDLVLLDVRLPGMNGVEVTAEILRHCPGTKIVILSAYDDENSVVGAIRSGAMAFIVKRASSTDLLEGMRTVAQGGSYLSSQVSERLVSRIRRGNLESKETTNSLQSVLSPRELQVLRFVAEGGTSKDVAGFLDLELQTVRTYRKTMMKKLGVSNVVGLTHVALAAGLVTSKARASGAGQSTADDDDSLG